MSTTVDSVAAFMRSYVSPGVTVIDVGANRGDFTQLLSELVGPNGHVVACEPNPIVYERLRETVARLANVEARQTALSDSCGKRTLYVDVRPGMEGLASSFYQLKDAVVEPVTVPCTTIDALGLSPAFIKVDVEGHEPSVFRGARQTIQHCRPVMVFEFWESWWERGYADLFAELARSSYRMTVLETGEDAAAVYPRPSNEAVNIGCVPLLTG